MFSGIWIVYLKEDEADRQDIAKTVAEKLREGKNKRKHEGNSDGEDDHESSTL